MTDFRALCAELLASYEDTFVISEPSDDPLVQQARAALRTAADQLTPEHYSCYSGHGEWDLGMDAKNDEIREEILAIAAELEGNND
jgi:hypothetical protein